MVCHIKTPYSYSEAWVTIYFRNHTENNVLHILGKQFLCCRDIACMREFSVSC